MFVDLHWTSIVTPTLVSAYIISMLLVIGVTILENRSPLKTISWILVLLLVPGLGFFLFVFFGQNLRKEKIIARKGLKNHDLFSEMAHAQISTLSNGDLVKIEELRGKENTVRLLLNNCNAVITLGNKIDFLINGEATYESIIEALENAQSYIHMEYYIFANDDLGSRIFELLKRKRQAGVEVRIIVDDVGSWELKRAFFNEMRLSGIEIFSFLQVRFPRFTSKVNYRNHRKIIVVDGEIGFVGGINIADRYVKGDENSYGIWRDNHLKIEGDAVNTMQQIFLTDWFFVSQKEITDPKYFPAHEPKGDKLIQIASSGPDSDWPALMMGFFQSIASAKKYVYIETPYFMPSESVLLALKVAALGGVDVRIIIPQKSDAFVTLLSSRSFIKEMLQAGVRFYFYKKGFLHSKTIIIDDVIASVGSANMDFRSFEFNFEVNAFVYDYEFALEVKKSFFDDLDDSEEITYKKWRKRPRIQKVKESFARLASPLF